MFIFIIGEPHKCFGWIDKSKEIGLNSIIGPNSRLVKTVSFQLVSPIFFFNFNVSFIFITIACVQAILVRFKVKGGTAHVHSQWQKYKYNSFPPSFNLIYSIWLFIFLTLWYMRFIQIVYEIFLVKLTWRNLNEFYRCWIYFIDLLEYVEVVFTVATSEFLFACHIKREYILSKKLELSIISST